MSVYLNSDTHFFCLKQTFLRRLLISIRYVGRCFGIL